MQAWTVEQAGGADQLKLIDTEQPSVSEGEILVEVSAAGINRLDINRRENHSPKDSSQVLGVEISGIVKENKSGDERFEIGTKVCGLVKDGGYAEYAVIPADRAMVLPENIGVVEAAAIPEVFLTAFQTIYWLGQLKNEETILIHAGASGVGTAAIQLAKRISNAKVIVTAGSKEKLDFCRSLGADAAINYKEEDFSSVVLNETGQQGADVILDFIGASYWQKNLESSAVDARWVLVGTLGGTEVENVSLGSLLQKRIQFLTTLLSPRSDEYKADLSKDFQRTVFPYFEKGLIKPIIHEVYDFKDLPETHKNMENNQNIGKYIVKMTQ